MISKYLLDSLHFSGRQTGLIMSVSAVSTLITPLVGCFLADRILPAERLLGISLLLGGSILFALYQVHSFWLFLGGYFCYTVAIGPAASLLNAIIFHQLPDRREYGSIRVWGTAGWIAVAWVFGWLWMRGRDGAAIPERLPDALLLSAMISITLGLCSFTLPASLPPQNGKKIEFLPKEAFAVARKPAFLWLAAITMMANITDRFYYYAVAKFLVQDGKFSEANMMPVQSLGQLPEVVAMLVLGRLTTRLGLLPVMILGAACNIARYTLFIAGNGSTATVIAGVLMHGLAYAFFFSTVFILLDSMTDQTSRAGAHQLFTLLYSGTGGVLGSWIAGIATDAFRMDDGRLHFQYLWSVPLAFSLVVFASLLLVGRHYFAARPANVELPVDDQEEP